MSIYRVLATSNHWLPVALRKCHSALINFSVPAPRLIVVPLLRVILFVRQLWYHTYRVLVCEPLFKAYCRRYGRNLHTGVFLHWIQGKGDMLLGDNVTFDGKSSLVFATQFSEHPTLRVGDNTGVGHNCVLIIGKEISIGSHCRIAPNVTIFDSPGHPLDPEQRKAGRPVRPEDVRPVTIGDNVWIGMGAIVLPGISIGNNSVISAGACVMSDVPENVVVAGNPARRIMALQKEPALITVRPSVARSASA
jgi:acetyltransferase-like isoleucine patch superfamily enzyme